MIVEQDGKVMINNRIGISGNADQEVRRMERKKCDGCKFLGDKNRVILLYKWPCMICYYFYKSQYVPKKVRRGKK